MITKISANTNGTNHRDILFKGLSDRMGKKVYNGFYNMSELFPRATTKSPIVGKLPTYFEKRIQLVTSDIKTAAAEIMGTFTEASNELREYTPDEFSTVEELKNKRSNSTVKKLEDVLKKYKILSRWDDFDLRYIDKGGKGSVWKLEGLRYVKGPIDDEFVIKVFHTKSIQQNDYHGCYPEINAAQYWMKTFGYETNRGKFYWGDVHEAYMINKFIDEDVRLPKLKPIPYNYGVKFTDEDLVHIHNVCKQYSYDWGGCVVINQVVNSNKFARKVMQEIQNTQENLKQIRWYKGYYWKPKGNYDSKNAGLALGIKYLPESARVECFEKIFEKRGKYTDRAMGYTLKYLPHKTAFKYYEILAKTSKDNVLKEILRNEIPLLATKKEYASEIKDELIVLENIPKEYRTKYIDEDWLLKYKKLAKDCYII